MAIGQRELTEMVFLGPYVAVQPAVQPWMAISWNMEQSFQYFVPHMHWAGTEIVVTRLWKDLGGSRTALSCPAYQVSRS
jgi:hypothetical protein